jgi:hypothetical protein
MTKETFVIAVEALHQQSIKDQERASALAAILGYEDVVLYDNSALVKAVIRLLQEEFPRIDGHCEIEHYCFELGFGRYHEQKGFSAAELWEQLCLDYNKGGVGIVQQIEGLKPHDFKTSDLLNFDGLEMFMTPGGVFNNFRDINWHNGDYQRDAYSKENTMSENYLTAFNRQYQYEYESNLRKTGDRPGHLL